MAATETVTALPSDRNATFTQATPVPLTTIFSPDAGCAALSAYTTSQWADDQVALLLDPSKTSSSCYPSGYSENFIVSSLWYSPGVCPHGWNYVATSVQSPVSGSAVTCAVCCPPNQYSLPPLDVNWGCFQFYASTGPVTVTTPGSANPSTTLFGNPIYVAWQESDLSKFTPASAPVVALANAGVTFPAQSSASTSATSTSPNTRTSSYSTAANTLSTSSGVLATGTVSPTHPLTSGLSTGAAAGIGVGATIGGILIFACLWWWFRRVFTITRRERKAQGQASSASEVHQVHQVRQLLSGGDKFEAPDTSLPHEADANATRAELEGHWPELEAVHAGRLR